MRHMKQWPCSLLSVFPSIWVRKNKGTLKKDNVEYTYNTHLMLKAFFGKLYKTFISAKFKLTFCPIVL